MKRVVVYAKGSLDAFVAAFIYWKLFKSDLGQTYVAADPLDSEFQNAINNKHAPDFVISIGANIQTVRLAVNNSQLFSYEVSDTFPAKEDDHGWHYTLDRSLSLTQLMLKVLNEQNYLTADTAEFKVMNQYLKFSNEPKAVVDDAVANQLAQLMPNLLPEDFQLLDKLLFSPMTAAVNLGKKTAQEAIADRYTRDLNRAVASVIRVRDSVCGQALQLYNSTLFEHPSAQKDFLLENSYAFIYEVRGDGVRGKLLKPSNQVGNAAQYLASAGVQVSGSADVADYLMSHAVFSALLAYQERA